MFKLLTKIFGIRHITRKNGSAYLDRCTIFNTCLFSIKVHRILDSDDDCLHDHPWAFLSIILKGGYYEWTLNKEGRKQVKFYPPFSILYRKPKHLHRLELPLQEASLSGMIYQTWNLRPATTLVITFRKVRKWGFVNSAGKWIYWRNYVQGSEKC